MSSALPGTFKALIEAKEQREKEDKARLELVEKDGNQNKPEPSLFEKVENKLAGNNDSNLLAPLENPASLLANAPEKLAGLAVKGASKLADKNKVASRSDAQMLADLRKSRGARTQVAIRISSDVKREIDAFLLEHDITQQDFFELAASRFMSKVLAELSVKPASKLAFEERRLEILYKTNIKIINLFRAYNKILDPETSWKGRDDTVGQKYNSVDIRLIEIGIIFVQSNYIALELTEPPKSFKYYAVELNKFVNYPFAEDTLDKMLESSRAKWRELTKKEIDLSFLD